MVGILMIVPMGYALGDNPGEEHANEHAQSHGKHTGMFTVDIENNTVNGRFVSFGFDKSNGTLINYTIRNTTAVSYTHLTLPTKA